MFCKRGRLICKRLILFVGYYHDLYAWAGKMNITTFFFEAFDEDWKGELNDPLGAEKHWGLFTVDRKAKLVMHDLYADPAPVKAGK